MTDATTPPPRAEQSICLCMIVKDEGSIIERCLASVKGLIDAWVICDTGSSDDTVARVHAALEGIPGELHRRPWVDFGTNRTEVLALARGKADYLLALDADMTASYEEGAKRGLSANSYLIGYTGGLDFRQRLLLGGDRSYRYVGAVHEYVEVPEDEKTGILDTIMVTHHADGTARPAKLQRDLDLLQRSFAVDPGNARTVFYLAQTYRDLGKPDEALELYEMRAGMGGWEEEVFYSLYQAAVLAGQYTGDWGVAFQAFIRAWEFRPSRLEPIYHVVNRLRRRREYNTALLFARPAMSQRYPSEDTLFVHRWIYTYGLALELALCASSLGMHAEAVAACDAVLACKDASPHARAEASRIHAECVVRTAGG